MGVCNSRSRNPVGRGGISLVVEVLVEYLLAEIVVDHSAMASAEDGVAATVGEKETLRGDLEDADGASDLDAFAKQFAKQLDIDWEESAE